MSRGGIGAGRDHKTRHCRRGTRQLTDFRPESRVAREIADRCSGADRYVRHARRQRGPFVSIPSFCSSHTLRFPFAARKIAGDYDESRRVSPHLRPIDRFLLAPKEGRHGGIKEPRDKIASAGSAVFSGSRGMLDRLTKVLHYSPARAVLGELTRRAGGNAKHSELEALH